jgi:hypothetical protein
MSSIAVLLAGVAVVWLIAWAVRHERVQSIKDQTGLFRMRDWEEIARQKEAAAELRRQRTGRRRDRIAPRS